jgi:hypothetical protein
MPAYPAYALLAAAVLLLVPGVRARRAKPSFEISGRKLTVAVLVAVAAFVVLPLGVIAAAPPLHDRGSDAVELGISLIPVSSAIDPHAVVEGNAVRLRWRARPTKGGAVFYRLFRTSALGNGVACAGRLNNAADNCRVYMDEIGVTGKTRFVEPLGRPNWTYRIGVAANWLNDFRYGDVYVMSPPVTARVP